LLVPLPRNQQHGAAPFNTSYTSMHMFQSSAHADATAAGVTAEQNLACAWASFLPAFPPFFLFDFFN